ncbi:hypothetical protein GPECTOR_94g650 [Gonium pectorale]|uniref:Uncharacterized protein n=1 Tax=Gonium pectorale TaxID=33097 RepID=A0A150G0G8_GONPE|nr:hypothetical protein GPECTOR_94g650 [Gonium pectorale]|eukprot:KXZ43328.1 hypothetical protein GPECTOR_94g650 [Gonium pectorale]
MPFSFPVHLEESHQPKPQSPQPPKPEVAAVAHAWQVGARESGVLSSPNSPAASPRQHNSPPYQQGNSQPTGGPVFIDTLRARDSGTAPPYSPRTTYSPPSPDRANKALLLDAIGADDLADRVNGPFDKPSPSSVARPDYLPPMTRVNEQLDDLLRYVHTLSSFGLGSNSPLARSPVRMRTSPGGVSLAATERYRPAGLGLPTSPRGARYGPGLSIGMNALVGAILRRV